MEVETNLNAWASVCRVQSIPVTVLPASVGAFAAVESVSMVEYVPFVAVLALAHTIVYADNELMDMEWDRKNGRQEKPLVSGDVSPSSVNEFVGLGAVVCVGVAGITFPTGATSLLLVSFVLGVAYNRLSKTFWYSDIFLGVWGVVITMTGAMYAGGVTRSIGIFGAGFGLYMMWMTYIGDYRDIGAEEANTLQELGARLSLRGSPDGERFRYIKQSMPSSVYGGFIALLAILVTTSAVENPSLLQEIATAPVALFALITSGFFVVSGDYIDDQVVSYIVVNTVAFALLFGAVGAFISSPEHIIALTGGSLAYGLSVQKILYGSFLYFP